MFPIVSEWMTGQRISIQAPYFNAFAPWIGLGLVLTIAIGNLMRYQTDKIPYGKKVIFLAILAAIPMTIFFVYMGDVMATHRPERHPGGRHWARCKQLLPDSRLPSVRYARL